MPVYWAALLRASNADAPLWLVSPLALLPWDVAFSPTATSAPKRLLKMTLKLRAFTEKPLAYKPQVLLGDAMIFLVWRAENLKDG
jgi:hypothetical protein